MLIRMINYEAMGRRIRRKRQEKGYTQVQFAAKIMLSSSFYGHIERGTRVPSLDTMVLIANALDIGLDILLRDSLKVKVPVGPRGLSVRDYSILRAYLSEQQEALEHWLDISPHDGRSNDDTA